MSLAIKSGTGAARVLGLRPEIVIAVMVANDVFQEAGFDCVITAGIDGSHSRGSIHYKGLAVDLRARQVPPVDQSKILAKLQERLGGDYDVILEADHYHVEFDPKTPINA
jgi:hypothetical protein